MNSVTIALSLEDIGSVVFDQPEYGLLGKRIASGVRINFPATITLRTLQQDPTPLILENLMATFCADAVEIGTSRYIGAVRSPTAKLTMTFPLDLTFEALAVFETIRAGGEPRFNVMLSGEIRYVLPGQGWKEALSIATHFSQSGFVKYSRDAWTKMLRDAKLNDAVLVEIPFQSNPPSGWEPVWHALQDARDSFDAGGSTGWKNCITSVRLALEEWRKIEPEERGPSELHQRTKAERLDNVRWTFMQFAHAAPHTRSEGWTREDALLALSTLTAMLAVRKP